MPAGSAGLLERGIRLAIFEADAGSSSCVESRDRAEEVGRKVEDIEGAGTEASGRAGERREAADRENKALRREVAWRKVGSKPVGRDMLDLGSEAAAADAFYPRNRSFVSRTALASGSSSRFVHQ